MRIEMLPLLVGVIAALVGLALLFDGLVPDDTFRGRERRRRPRVERSRAGEVCLGLGALGMAAALFGRDVWRYSILCAIVAGVFLLLGLWANRKYMGAWLSTRGKSRRGYVPPPKEEEKVRIR